MKTLKSVTHFSMLGSAVALSLCLMPQAQAAPPGQCVPKQAHRFDIPFTKTLEKPSDNVINQVVTESWKLGGLYVLDCDCPNSVRMGRAFISSTTALPAIASKDNGGKEYQLNDYLAVSADVWIGGTVRDFKPIPLDLSNNANPGSGKICNVAEFSSGSEGKLYLRFIQPFTGVQTIPETELLAISISTEQGAPSPVATRVYIKGTVTVPQSCSFDPSPITVNFGTPILSTEFKTKGEMPDGFTEEHRTITLNCRNISEGVRVDLTFTGTPDPTDKTLLKTAEDGTGVAIRIDGIDRDGQRIQILPTEGHLPVNIDYNNGNLQSQAIADIYVSPRNTTGKPAKVGDFTATATVNAVIP